MSIRDFASKELEALWNGARSKIDAKLHKRLLTRLDALDAAVRPESMNLPGFDFHELKGDRKGTYSVHVNGPRCITFRFDAGDAFAVDFEQYHDK